MRRDPDRPDSPAIQRALLPARIAWWRSQGHEEFAQQLEAQLAAAEKQAPEAIETKQEAAA